MKKALLLVPIILPLVGCGGDIGLVKDGVMEFNKTITIGQALDNWKSCDKSKWEEFETDNGVKVVQFSCNHKTWNYIEKAKSLLSESDQVKAVEKRYFDVALNTQTFQFTLNNDDSFQIDNVQVKTLWADGTVFEDSQEPLEQLGYAYQNEILFDSSELNEATIDQVSFLFQMIKPTLNK